MLKIYRQYNLDGAACELILRLRAESKKTDVVVIPANPRSLDKAIETLLDGPPVPLADELWIVGMCPSKANCARLNKAYAESYLQITLIDHHKVNDWVKQYPWATVSTKQCTAQLLCREVGLTDEKLLKFIDAVAAWSLFLIPSLNRKRGEDLHQLLKFLGDTRFIAAFGIDFDADIHLPHFLYILETLRNNSERYVKKVIDYQLQRTAYYTDNYGNAFKVLLAIDQHQNIGQAVLNHPEGVDLKYVVIANPVTNLCSVFSRLNGIDISVLIKKLGGGWNDTKNAATFFTDLRQHTVERIASVLIFQ